MKKMKKILKEKQFAGIRFAKVQKPMEVVLRIAAVKVVILQRMFLKERISLKRGILTK